MLLVTIEYLPGQNFVPIGFVKGSTVQSKHIGKDLMAGFKNMVGGELTSYTEMLNEARAIATDRMMTEAQALGADAVVGLRFSSASIMDGAAEVMACGTAVRFT